MDVCTYEGCCILQRLCVSIIMSFTELMTPDHYRWLRSTFDVKEELEVWRERQTLKLYAVSWLGIRPGHFSYLLTVHIVH